ncbi:unnamed protein product [Caenorhabditis auriculariae]|uniref:AAA+ ATPase domain-containing protein n=1 Tax=Caenorhabditis auriculariae TaxID=2777116 RepID=A0A8S1HRP7_9PELO|nr:unnamed protein product [Caenorhabditis auriculariae]
MVADIDGGHLGAVLQLLYLLSTFKQRLRQQKRELKKLEMPPAVSKLPSPLRPQSSAVASISATSATTTTMSRIQPPTRIAVPPNKDVKTCTTPIKTSGLKPPGSSIRPPSRSNGNNNGSSAASTRSSSSVASSATYASIPSISPSPSPVPKAIQTPSTNRRALQPPKTTTATRIAPARITTNTVANDKNDNNMLKLKLFNKKQPSPQQSPSTTRKAAPAAAASTTRSVLKAPTKFANKKQPQQIPITETAIQVRNSTPPKRVDTVTIEKRCSKSSEEDSAYVGFNSTSPASSTEGSISMHSTSALEKGFPPNFANSEEPSATSMSSKPKPVDEKPTLAVKGVTKSEKLSLKPLRRPKPCPTDDGDDEDSSPTETLEPRFDAKEKEKAPAVVGVVSPMLNQRKFAEEVPEKPSTSTTTSPQPNDLAKPQQSKASRLETTFDAQDTPHTIEVPTMPPIRQPPTYNQLLQQGRICAPSNRLGFVDSSTSEDSLDSVSTTIRLKPSASTSAACGYVSEGTSLDASRSHTTESSGYASEGGVAMYTRMKEKMREYGDVARRAHDYPDSFEDSSSVSSGISENLDDVSTDDLSGTDHPMASVAYGKIGDYQHFVRGGAQNGARNGRAASSSVDARARRYAEQENIHKLLSQCRTSQRGAATAVGQHSLRSPGYATIAGGCSPQLALSADGDTLSVHSRASLRASSSSAHHKRPDQGNSYSGFHSLDRKCHLLDYLSDHDRAAMALVSPRRMPSVDPRASTSAGRSLSFSCSRPERLGHESVDDLAGVALATDLPAQRLLIRVVGGDGGPPLVADAVTTRPFAQGSPSSHSSVYRFACSMSARTTRDGIYANLSDAMHLQKYADDIYKSPSNLNRNSEMGSQLSLASSTAYATLNDKYESEIRKMARDLDVYRQTVSKLTKKQENYAKMFDDTSTSPLSSRRMKSANFGTISSIFGFFSGRLASAHAEQLNMDGAGELLRQPSLESVASHRSSMSSSSKSSKTDKSSLNSFGKSKKGWIRSSLTKAFSKKKNKSAATSDNECSPMRQLTTITGSHNRLDEIEVRELRRKLDEREEILTDVRLDALDRARQVEVLRETVNKLKSENKQLKQDMNRLLTVRSRASSHASIPVMGDEEHFYEIPPCQSSSGSASFSSKRSSGCNSVKVTVNVDLRGTISDVICPDNEIIVGFLPLPAKETTWAELDQLIVALFQAYMERIDIERHLELNPRDAIVGYQMGDVRRETSGKAATTPSKSPADVLTPTTTIRMFLRGAEQERVDSLVLDTLLPKSMLEQLVRFLFTQRRLVLAGAAGLGKSKLARELAAYTSMRIGETQDCIVDIKIPDESGEKLVKVEKQLETLLQSKKPCVLLIDNVPKNRIAFVASVFANIPLAQNEGPYVLCTVNRYQLVEMQVHQNFKMFLLTNCMEGVNGFMARFLRRRTIEAEYRQCRQTPSELVRVIQFLPVVLDAMNKFIAKTNSPDVTIGPRVFLQCPLGVDESRQWFIRLWNDNFVPYMEKVAREGKKNFGRCASFEDPTDVVGEHWPWLEGPPVEDSLQRLSLHDIVPSGNTPKQPFNPLESLIQLHASKNSAIDNI